MLLTIVEPHRLQYAPVYRLQFTVCTSSVKTFRMLRANILIGCLLPLHQQLYLNTNFLTGWSPLSQMLRAATLIPLSPSVRHQYGLTITVKVNTITATTSIPLIVDTNKGVHSCKSCQVDVILDDHYVPYIVAWVDSPGSVCHEQGVDAHHLHGADCQGRLWQRECRRVHIFFFFLLYINFKKVNTLRAWFFSRDNIWTGVTQDYQSDFSVAVTFFTTGLPNRSGIRVISCPLGLTFFILIMQKYYIYLACVLTF